MSSVDGELGGRGSLPFRARIGFARPLGLTLALIAGLMVVRPLPAQGVVTLTSTPITWDVIGLDSNDEVNDGPNIFSAGTRICNTGDTTSSVVTATFSWDTANTYIDTQTGSPTVIALYDAPNHSWAPGDCNDFYFNIEVDRDSNAIGTAREYHITAVGDGGATATTPMPRQLYVDSLISQNRNSIASITGPTAVSVGSVYQYTVTGSTSTDYEELTTYLNFPNTIFRIISVDAQYITEGATNDKIWADACGWDSNPLLVPPSTSSNCVGPTQYGGKVGGSITTTFDVEILSAGTATMIALWYDGSGGSFHYNKDFNDGAPNTITVTATAPTAARFVKASAVRSATGTSVRWTTANEIDNLGFNVYADRSGAPLNDDLIAGSAVRTTAAIQAGGTYRWLDPVSESANGYFIEAVDLSGGSTWHGPIRVVGRTKAIGTRSPTLSARSDSLQGETTPAVAEPGATDAAAQAAISGGPAASIDVDHEGWYRVALSDIASRGVDVSDPANVHVYADGIEQAVQVDGTSLRFYGLGLDTPDTDTRVYWVTSDGVAGLRMQESGDIGGPAAPAAFMQRERLWDPILYFSALINGDASNFFTDVVTATPSTYVIDLPHLASADGATLQVDLQGVYKGGHDVTVGLNGAEIGHVTMSNREAGSATFPVDPGLVQGPNTVTLSSSGPTDLSLLASLEVEYVRAPVATGGALHLTAPAGSRSTVTGFDTADLQVLDVTAPDAPVALATDVIADGGGAAAVATSPGDGDRELFAAQGSDTPAAIRTNDPSDLRDPGNGADMLIVTTDALASAFAPLAERREQQGLGVQIVSIQDVYDEFSFGAADPAALHDFLTTAHETWATPPRYVLLGGDATLDPRDYLAGGQANSIPTTVVDTEFMETASDSALADADGDLRPDVALGRLPVSDEAQATFLVTKLRAYDATRRSKRALFVADPTDDGVYAETNRAVQRLLPAAMSSTSIRTSGGGANARVVAAINKGPSVTHYSGHGSVDLWSEDALHSSDTAALTNTAHPSLFIMITCLNGYFFDPGIDSLGEALLEDDGGAIGVYASTGLTYHREQRDLTLAFTNALFNRGGSRVGDAVVAASNAVTDEDILKTWLYLGDPSMRLR